MNRRLDCIEANSQGFSASKTRNQTPLRRAWLSRKSVREVLNSMEFKQKNAGVNRKRNSGRKFAKVKSKDERFKYFSKAFKGKIAKIVEH